MANKVEWIIEVDTKTGQTHIRELAQTQDESTSSMERQENVAKSLKGSFLGLWTAVGAGAGIYAGMRLMDTVNEWEKLTGVQEVAEKQLSQSMKSAGRYSEQYFQDMKNLAASLQNVTTFGDEATMQGMKFLFTYKQIGDDMMPRTVRAMQDFAALSGGDVAQAANVLGKAAMGMTGELAQYGITVEQDTFKTKGFAGVLDEIETQIKGQAEALRQTRAGELTAFGNAVGDLKEKLGDFSLSVKALVAKDALDDIAALDGKLADMKGAKYHESIREIADQIIVVKDASLTAVSAVGTIAMAIKCATESYAEMIYGGDTLKKQAVFQLNKANEELQKYQKKLDRAKGTINNDVEIVDLEKLIAAKEREIEVRNAALVNIRAQARAEAELADIRAGKNDDYEDSFQGLERIKNAPAPVADEAPAPEAVAKGGTSSKKAYDGDMGLEDLGSGIADIYEREVELAEQRKALALETADVMASISMGEFEYRRYAVEQEAALRAESYAGDQASLSALAEWKMAQFAEISQAEIESRAETLQMLQDMTLQANTDAMDSIYRMYEFDASMAQDRYDMVVSAAQAEADAKKEALDQEIADLEEKYAGEREMIDAINAYKQAKNGEIETTEQLALEKAKKDREDKAREAADQMGEDLRTAGKYSKAAFTAYKAFATAQAVIKTYEAATGAYAALAWIPAVGPALGAAAAAAAIAAGLANVASITQQQPPTTSYGYGGVSWAPEVALVGERGPEAHVPLKGGNIPVQITGGGGGGSSKHFNLTIAVSGNTFRSQAAEDAHTRALAAEIVDQLAVSRIVDDFVNDGEIRAIIAGGA